MAILVVSGILQDQYVTEQSTTSESGPLIMNAFEMITLSQGLNLSALFDRRQEQLHTFYFGTKASLNIASILYLF